MNFGAKYWHCTDCGERGFGEFPELEKHWDDCPAYQKAKTNSCKPAPEWPTEEEVEMAIDVAMDGEIGDSAWGIQHGFQAGVRWLRERMGK